ncbi:MAG: metallophosphoesterase family protein [Actinomycetota bacterium]
MRVGLISDVHGNRIALDAVLNELEREGVDQIVCLGDVAVGPQPGETLARIRELGCPVVMGNWDAAFLGDMPAPKDEVGKKLVEIGEWWAKFLSPADREFMQSFVPTFELELDGRDAVFFHGSPHSYDDWIFSTTPDEELRAMFDGFEMPVLVGGHTHLQMIRRFDEAVIVNPGSVGLPFREWWPRPVRISPWAEYGILSGNDGRLSLDLRRTDFDVDAFLALSLESGMPHAQWWADCWVRG